MAPGWLESVGPVLVRETNVKLPGSETIAERLAEVLLIQVLRAYLPTLGQSRGFLGALTDARLSRAVKLIHNHAGDALTLEELARAAGMSRSNLALRFKQDLGIAPMTYLTQWRLLTAREMLRHSTASVADVAARVGYRSDVAFARAFKRAYDVTPGRLSSYPGLGRKRSEPSARTFRRKRCQTPFIFVILIRIILVIISKWGQSPNIVPKKMPIKRLIKSSQNTPFVPNR